jgi:hypothetical protein
VDELRPGLWHWRASHPDWSEEEPWQREVSSYALDDGRRLLLFDPLEPPGELEVLAGERETAIVLTAPWHERSTRSLVELLGVPVHTPPPDTARDLMDKFGNTPERAGAGSPDLRWLLDGGGEGRFYAAGDTLPFGARVFPGREHNDLVLWLEAQRTVIAGDTLVDFGAGLEINPRWLRPAVSWERVAEGLRPLLAEPVELVLAAHGGPHGPEDLARAVTR